VLPLGSIFKSKRDIHFKGNSSLIFSELKKSLLKVIDDMYWIPFKQRRTFISHANEAGILFTADTKYKIYDNSVYASLSKGTDFYQIIFSAVRRKYHYEMDGYIITPLFTNTVSYYDGLRQNIGKINSKSLSLSLSLSLSQCMLPESRAIS
jgi:hypothetical protein